MNQGQPPPTALDDILNRTRHLLLSFDGPICPLSTYTPSMQITSQLRTTLTEQDITLPREFEQLADWREILTHAVATNQQLAETIESELTNIESLAVRSLRPTLHLHELAAACRDSSYSLTVVSDISIAVIRTYLAEHSLDNAIPYVIARTSGQPVAPKQGQIEQAARDLNTVPAACAMLTSTSADINAARNAGASSIGYVSTDEHDSMIKVEADAAAPSLADLTLRLRARYGASGL